jgi:protein ImuB
MLWLCIHLPRLVLDVLQRGETGDAPLVVVANGEVVAASDTAATAGVRAGMRLTAAQALAPELRHRERAPQAEAHALARLADWSLQFTSQVSPQPPRALLLEVGGSLRYFGGLERLREHLRAGLRALGYRPVLAVAPTPTAAWLLARGGRERPVTREERLRQALAELPVSVLDLDESRRRALAGLGLRTLGDCLALPRDGLARRFGPAPLQQLDRALGRLAEPRRSWRAPPRFRSDLELPAEIHDTEQLLFALNRLLLELCGYLRGIQSGVQRIEVRLLHRRDPATAFHVGLVTPGRDPGHLRELTHQRLERLCLPAPVVALSLAARQIRPLAPRHDSLIADEDTDPAQDTSLLERLSARLGDNAVQGLQLCHDHRPERAWQTSPPGRKSPPLTTPERPLWLLRQPLELETRGGQPLQNGPLVLREGPERIESGWWDGADVARDYYIATNGVGEQLWIFRERRGRRGWYVHGFFA